MISIIVPIYNAEEYLQACIESLIRQTEKDLQLNTNLKQNPNWQ